MTKKQKQKIANEIATCEKIHSSATTSSEEKNRAEARILQLTHQIMTSDNGMTIMGEIDELVQKIVNKGK